ncbi:MAG: hypothetical protein K2X91_00820 [Thermoleophilia bacterium]|nr:hypothetical protein [Thermoleophilia bacterium]
MSTEQSRVIVTTGGTANTTVVSHRDFPEIRADGANAREAAAHLVGQLQRALDSALTTWRRQTLERAIADVQAFADAAP